MKKYFAILSVTLVLGLLAGMLAFTTVGADPIIGKRIQLPRIDVDDDWETWIQVFNKGGDSYVLIDFYGETVHCPGEGPVQTLCRHVSAGGVWTVKGQIDSGAKSAVVRTFDTAVKPTACGGTRAITWDQLPDATASEVAVTVDRIGPNGFGTTVASAYTGISDEMHGEHVVTGAYRYFVPYVMKGYHDLDTVITIQNSGYECVSTWLYFARQGICNYEWTYHILELAPGESIRIEPKDLPMPCTGPGFDGWLGSGYIESDEPLGIIVDQISDPSTAACASGNRGMLLTWRGMPYKRIYTGEPGYREWDLEWYADLLFREWSGWDSSIQVQNLTQYSTPTLVTVDIMDQSGDQVAFLADWVLANCAETFYLPAVSGIPMNYAGAAVIKSHGEIDWPGEWHEGQPIFVIVDLKNEEEGTPSFGQGGAYNAHPVTEKERVLDIALPHLAKNYDGVTSVIALRNNSNCNKIKPHIYFKNEEGRTVCTINSFWLQPKHVKLISLDQVPGFPGYIGCLPGQWVGAAEVLIEDVEQLCDTDGDGHVDSMPTMPSIVVVNVGTGASDTTRVYEGFPVEYGDVACYGEVYGKVIDANTSVLLNGVEVSIPGVLCGAEGVPCVDLIVPGDAGNFQIDGVPCGDAELRAAKVGYLTGAKDFSVEHAGDMANVDFELVCNTNMISGTVTMTPSAPVQDANVTGTWVPHVDTLDTGSETDVTDALGYYELPDLPKEVAITVVISKELFDTITTTHTFTEPLCSEVFPISERLQKWAKVTGIVWYDVNTDTVKDPGEPVAVGETVDLYTDGLLKLLASTTTNEYGQFSFWVSPQIFLTDFTWGDNLDVAVLTATANADNINEGEVVTANIGL